MKTTALPISYNLLTYKDIRQNHRTFTETLSTGTKKQRILVVDDSQVNRFVLKKILIAEEYGCELASNGAEALNHLKHSYFDLILMDIVMPVMNGIEAAKKIKVLYPETPVIAVTSIADKICPATLENIGFDAILRKPPDKVLFLHTINQALNFSPKNSDNIF